jgi:hypothetical protein
MLRSHPPGFNAGDIIIAQACCVQISQEDEDQEQHDGNIL